MENKRKWTTYIGGSDIVLSDVHIVPAPNTSAPCAGCIFLKITINGFYCTFSDNADNRKCNPGFSIRATVYKKINYCIKVT